jgi:predicted ArsR family transcriptional regulator
MSSDTCVRVDTVHDPGASEKGLDAIAGLADGARRALYRFVVEQPDPVSKDEAAAHAGISRSLAAYHLDRLTADGLLVVSYARLGGRRGPGAGRPAKLYAAARTEVSVQLPPRDDTLLARLLAAAVDADPSGAARDALLDIARAEGERAAAEYRASDDALSTMLARRGYAPRVTHDEIRLRNCPFHHLVDEHRDLVCGLNLALLDAALGALDRTYRAELEPSGDFCCVVLHRRAARPDTATTNIEAGPPIRP